MSEIDCVRVFLCGAASGCVGWWWAGRGAAGGVVAGAHGGGGGTRGRGGVVEGARTEAAGVGGDPLEKTRRCSMAHSERSRRPAWAELGTRGG